MAQVGVHTVAHPNEYIIDRQPLVIVGHTQCSERVPGRPVGIGPVAREHLVGGARRLDRAQQIREAEGNILRNHLSDTDHVIALERLDDRVGVDGAATCLQPW